MTRPLAPHFAALAVLWVACASGQPLFKATATTEATPEGGRVSMLLIQTGDERFSIQIPKGYGAQTRPGERTIVFNTGTGASVITLKVSTNYAGTLPKMEVLRDEVAKKYASASLVQTSPCYTGYTQGLLFDLFEPAAGSLTLRVRDAYVSFPEGSFEFTFSCNSADYDKERLSFAWLLNSFRSEPQTAKKAP